MTDTTDKFYTRTLIISVDSSFNPPKDPTLLLTFCNIDDSSQQVCWKITKFPRNSGFTLQVVYESQLCFISPRLTEGNIIEAQAWININMGEKTTLKQDESGILTFSNPVPDRKHHIMCSNETTAITNLVVGGSSREDPPNALFYYPDIGVGYNADCKFVPVLTAYIVKEKYHENQIITEEITNPVIWEQNLEALGEVTSMKLTYDDHTGTYALTIQS